MNEMLQLHGHRMHVCEQVMDDGIRNDTLVSLLASWWRRINFKWKENWVTRACRC